MQRLQRCLVEIGNRHRLQEQAVVGQFFFDDLFDLGAVFIHLAVQVIEIAASGHGAQPGNKLVAHEPHDGFILAGPAAQRCGRVLDCFGSAVDANEELGDYINVQVVARDEGLISRFFNLQPNRLQANPGDAMDCRNNNGATVNDDFGSATPGAHKCLVHGGFHVHAGDRKQNAAGDEHAKPRAGNDDLAERWDLLDEERADDGGQTENDEHDGHACAATAVFEARYTYRWIVFFGTYT